jgi:GT2 family glycosyltransferase
MEHVQSAPADEHESAQDDDGIAVVVLTHDRLHLLRQCVEKVLGKVSPATREIVIWDNASTDGTAEYLATLTDPRIRVVKSESNIGQSGYARAFRLTSSPYMIEIDDDVTDAPPHWDRTLLDAFRRLPGIGFLAADLEDDPNDEASRYRHHIRPHEYAPVEENGIRLLVGPTGGGCAITSRELNERVGGFSENTKEIFWLEDEKYIADLGRIGFRAAVLADLRVHHTGGSYYSTISREKASYWDRRFARQERRDAVKRVLVKIPFVRRLNARFRWFVSPS